MEHFFTDERNAQIVISLLKAHEIKKVIVSPGTTDICLVASLMNDAYFEMYSSPEERSAGYIACGMAAECNEPVVIVCTGATASRNYLPALTEAYYRKLPVLAITCSRRSYRIGHNIDQVTDRTCPPKDSVKISVQVPLVYDIESEWNAIVEVNRAILELRHRDNGPVHINLETNYSLDYTTKVLPPTRKITRIMMGDSLPKIKAKSIAVFVGSHREWSTELTEVVDLFCETNNAFVLCDHTSNYKGLYSINGCIAGQQLYTKTKIKDTFDLIIHIGDVHAPWFDLHANHVWRVNPDGEIRDTFRKLDYVFEMQEDVFFRNYCIEHNKETSLFNDYNEEQKNAINKLKLIVDKIPFSNAWIASQTQNKLQKGAELHLGIQNSLRFWNFFEVNKGICVYSNVGGFGIDGIISSAIGAALCKKDKIYYCIIGDLAFFYDINSLGNRHLPPNLRILLINNGIGAEFKLTGNPGGLFGDETDKFIAAGGHYGNKSKQLVKHYAEDLGFRYLSAESKDEYLANINEFVTDKIEYPIIYEVFTNSENEDLALKMIRTCMADTKELRVGYLKDTTKRVLGHKNIEKIKKILE